MNTYDELKLTLTSYIKNGDDEQFKVWGGELGDGDVDFSKLDADLRLTARQLAEGDLDAEEIAVFGDKLGKLLFPPKMRLVFDVAYKAAEKNKRALRIRLDFHSNELANLPWEYIRLDYNRATNLANNPDARSYLALDPNISLVRSTRLDPLDTKTFEQLRVVGLFANTKGQTQLNLEAEQKNLQAVFDERKSDVVFVAASATLDVVSDLAKLKANVLHFSGHGTFKGVPGIARDSGIGSIIIQRNEGGESESLSVGDLAVLVKSSGCYAVVLNSCLGGKVDGVNQWTGIAPALSAAGVPIVIAMQFEVNDDVAIAFSETLYSALMRNESFDQALCLARIRAWQMGPQGRDWGAPVLYLRGAGDLGLFSKIENTPSKISSPVNNAGKLITKLVLSTEKISELKNLLQQCKCFLSDDALRAIFSLRPTLQPFRLKVRSAPDPVQRVDLFVDDFLTRNMKGGKPIMVEFLETVHGTLDGEELQDDIQGFLNSI